MSNFDAEDWLFVFLSFLMHAGLCVFFYNLPNSDLDYRIFNMHAFTQRGWGGGGGGTVVYSLIERTLVEFYTEFDSGEISGQSIASNIHPSPWWPLLFKLLNLAFESQRSCSAPWMSSGKAAGAGLMVLVHTAPTNFSLCTM